MIYLLIFAIPISTNLNFPADNVIETTKEILTEWGIPVCVISDNKLTTKPVEIDVKTMSNYQIEDQPDENPGWTASRFSLMIGVSEIEKGKTEIEIDASLERYGTPSAMLLIPPIWTPVPSNGKMEREFLDEIEKRLSKEEK